MGALDLEISNAKAQKFSADMVALDLQIRRHPNARAFDPNKINAWTSRSTAKPSSSLPDSNGVEEDPVTQDGNQYDYEDVDIFQNMPLYSATIGGGIADFCRALGDITSAPAEQVLRRISPAGNTLVHVAAKKGKLDIIKYLKANFPNLMSQKNINGDTALHLASKAGDQRMVEELVSPNIPDFSIGKDVEAASNDLVRQKNMRGNTALHEAVLNGRKLVAKYLIQQDSEILKYRNHEGETALYLAAKADFADIVSLILESCLDRELPNENLEDKSPIHAAIRSKNIAVLKAFLTWNPSLSRMRDKEGQTSLHIAVSLGNLEAISNLLRLSAFGPSVSDKDKNGICPIHVASYEGRVDILTHLLQHCPAPAELLNKHGGNILHTAASSGRYNIIKFILNDPKFDELINMKDLNGDSPLHMATMGWHPKIVSALTWDKRVDINLVNDKGMTALDAAEYHMVDNPPFCQRLTWAALKSAGTPRSPFTKVAKTSPNTNHIVELSNQRVNTLLLVATLVATITFAAGITMPGGYDSSPANLGMPSMLRERGFPVFVLSDSIAMYSSIIVSVILIYAQLGDPSLVLTALQLALPLLGIALSMMSVAFTAGVYIVVSRHRWLGAAGLVMACTFLPTLVLLFLPLCTPDSSNNRILRYISHYPFQLLILATCS